jgi:hypothetical protein
LCPLSPFTSHVNLATLARSASQPIGISKNFKVSFSGSNVETIAPISSGADLKHVSRCKATRIVNSYRKFTAQRLGWAILTTIARALNLVRDDQEGGLKCH